MLKLSHSRAIPGPPARARYPRARASTPLATSRVFLIVGDSVAVLDLADEGVRRGLLAGVGQCGDVEIPADIRTARDSIQ
jgi:hypothetical protein